MMKLNDDEDDELLC